MRPAPAPVEETAPQAESHPTSQKIWQRYHATGAGDVSEEELVKEYLPLVRTVVGRLAISLPPHVETDDLYSAGLIGLLQAIRQYKPGLGASFESYARVRIRGSVLDELRRMDWVPRSVHAKARRIQTVMAELENKFRRLPSDDEIAGALQISVPEYRRWLDQVRPASFVCLDAVQSPEGDDDCSEHEVIADVTQQDASEKATRAEMVSLIAERIQALPELHRKIVAFYYYEGMRLREIAQICNLSESRICQIHTQVVLSLKAHLEERDAIVVPPN
jgi:RNA polymerase sigma factor for flagellar operon FliA